VNEPSRSLKEESPCSVVRAFNRFGVELIVPDGLCESGDIRPSASEQASTKPSIKFCEIARTQDG
jgi:hypothetical protein